MGAAEDGNENKNYVRKIKAKVIDITELTCYNGAKKPAGKKYTFCQPVSMKRKQPEGNPLRLFCLVTPRPPRRRAGGRPGPRPPPGRGTGPGTS